MPGKFVEKPDRGIEEIRIIVFSIMGIRFGMDIEFIAEICDSDAAKRRKVNLFFFHEKLNFRKRPVTYERPKVLLIKDGDGVTGIVIDSPEEINVRVPTEDIRPLPGLIRGFEETAPIWGVTILEKSIIQLVDPYKMMKNK